MTVLQEACYKSIAVAIALSALSHSLTCSGSYLALEDGSLPLQVPGCREVVPAVAVVALLAPLQGWLPIMQRPMTAASLNTQAHKGYRRGKRFACAIIIIARASQRSLLLNIIHCSRSVYGGVIRTSTSTISMGRVTPFLQYCSMHDHDVKTRAVLNTYLFGVPLSLHKSFLFGHHCKSTIIIS